MMAWAPSVPPEVPVFSEMCQVARLLHPFVPSLCQICAMCDAHLVRVIACLHFGAKAPLCLVFCVTG